MDESSIINIAQEALKVILYVSAPILVISMVVGLVISIFQATTQIQEQTLTFVPKILSVVAAIALFGSWMLRVLIEYTQNIFININQFIK
ncbi:flagellar biosynthetic protein FliQ [Ruminiclostridium papyrosolvens DSM 2782]|uniref:Flagellar biosynthetic protein FliQ n=1 Tax=Ruminiclostridium papyrosolvens DSM 2782 TaxID=588581 RepID=F1THN4_9FIRM|nr:flagellar biosynthesis protein FliQ [Ruminiclostridium papyrosolvens]EGD46016.1 flagellar biosynthetic protein FliQ [Ruminiclostridium papyrosolvens DSM 2782]WES32816.1 flagellar biosynthesis protein FliQ [Ruminiclostridium papyrosolvens DSM 2782]